MLAWRHLDHILGLGGLISTFGRWEAIEEIEIWGGTWALDRVERLMEVVFGPGRRPIRIEFCDVRRGVLLEDEAFVLSAFPVTHRGPGCFGYAFEEKSRRPFLAHRAEALGVPRGPERGRLVRGEPVTLDDGTVIQPQDVLGPEQAGARLVFVGDAATTRNLHSEAQGADVLVIEATYLSRERDLAHDFGHLTALEAAELARDARAKTLMSNRHRQNVPFCIGTPRRYIAGNNMTTSAST